MGIHGSYILENAMLKDNYQKKVKYLLSCRYENKHGEDFKSCRKHTDAMYWEAEHAMDNSQSHMTMISWLIVSLATSLGSHIITSTIIRKKGQDLVNDFQLL